MTLEAKNLGTPDETRSFENGDSGRMHVVDDGREAEAGPGDAFVIAPGHDAWIVGDEPCVAPDWSGAANYAKPAS
jgi:hypothetical protein